MLTDLLRAAASAEPDRQCVVGPSGAITYGELLARSEIIAGSLLERRVDRFGCLVDDPVDLVALLCASAAVGAEACIYPGDFGEQPLRSLAAALGHQVVVTDRPSGSTGLRELQLSDLLSPAAPVDTGAGAEPAPVLILTSGTTGIPKGARHDWRRLVAAAQRSAVMDPEARWLLTYNPGQFAGIQVLLHALVAGATLVVPKSRNPRDILVAMEDSAVTHASGTPTFWRLLTAEVRDRASSVPRLRQITMGGEVVPEQLLAQVTELFPAARISQVYAATEFGSTVSVNDGRPGLPLSVLDRGEGSLSHLRINDGELEVRSRAGMIGYHEDRDIGDDWVPTGDLVEVRGDRIFFVGRKTERINVGGSKVYPVQVEEVVTAVGGVAMAAAYGRPNPITGQVVALDVVLSPGRDRSDVEPRIREAVAVLPPPARPRLIRFVDNLEVRAGKVVRPGGPGVEAG